MSSSRMRGVARRSAVLVAALALTATTGMSAFAQEEPAPTTPVAEAPVTETPVEKPAETPAETPVDKPAEQPVEAQPEKPSDEKAQAAPNVTATAKIAAGPFLVGQQVPFELTITNSGDAEATGVGATTERISGSWFSINSDGWDGLKSPWDNPTTTLAAGASKTFNIKGSTFQYDGNAKFRVRVSAKNEPNQQDGFPEVEVPYLAPEKKGKISGILWGDANGNGVQDAGEGLSGALAYLYGGGDPNVTPKTRTDANGRFTFTDLELRAWGLSFNELPGGWVLKYISDPIPVDGSDSTSELRFQAVRPLEDQLTASMRWLSTEHVDGGKATVEFTLTNRGGADIKGVIAGCNRSGEGPYVNIYEGLGELAWGKGATIPAGQSRVFVATGTIPDNASEYGYTYLACDFGPEDGLIDGFPQVYDYVKVGNGTADTHGSIFVDHNDNGWQDAEGEHLTGVSFSLVDPKTGAVVATATGEGEHGHAYFRNIPRGLYKVKVNGPYEVVSEWYVSTRMPGWAVEVRPADAPGGAQPQPEPNKVAPVVHRSGLALTGANVTSLGAFGVLALLVGAAAVYFGRRKTA